jgi:hypothetical protein
VKRATLRQMYQYLTWPYYVLFVIGIVNAMFLGALSITNMVMMRQVLGEIEPDKSDHDTAGKLKTIVTFDLLIKASHEL